MITNETEENGWVGITIYMYSKLYVSFFLFLLDTAVLYIYRLLVYSGEEETFSSTSPLPVMQNYLLENT